MSAIFLGRGGLIGRLLAVLIAFSAAAHVRAEVVPPVPAHHFNDEAAAVSTTAAARLERTLADFQQRTGTQFVVAVYQHMQSDAPIADYTLRVAKAWGVGEKGKNNGVVMFVFLADRHMYIQVGTGLMAALPNADVQRIIDHQITPAFHEQDIEGGLTAGVAAVITALEGRQAAMGPANATPSAGEGSDPAAMPEAGSTPDGPVSAAPDPPPAEAPVAPFHPGRGMPTGQTVYQPTMMPQGFGPEMFGSCFMFLLVPLVVVMVIVNVIRGAGSTNYNSGGRFYNSPGVWPGWRNGNPGWGSGPVFPTVNNTIINNSQSDSSSSNFDTTPSMGSSGTDSSSTPDSSGSSSSGGGGDFSGGGAGGSW